MARRYEFYILVARTISHERASLTREILFLPLEHKIHIFSPPCNILYILPFQRNAVFKGLRIKLKSILKFFLISCHDHDLSEHMKDHIFDLRRKMRTRLNIAVTSIMLSSAVQIYDLSNMIYHIFT